jgi:hypothetical protein
VFEVEATSELTLPDGRPLGLMNTTSIGNGEIAGDPEVQRLAREISRWVDLSRNSPTAHGGMFDRQAYTPPNNPYDQIRTAKMALIEDDVVGTVAEATEAIAFRGGLKWEAPDPDDADVFNQMAADLNLDDQIRTMWREAFATDQFVCAKLWGWSEYTVRGKTTKGNQRKKKYRIWCPQRLVMLNSEHVVPLGIGPLRTDRLAWNANPADIVNFDAASRGDIIDPLMVQFFKGLYTPSDPERTEFQQWHIYGDRLLEMDPAWVFRHCHTKPDYLKFPDLRLRSVFPLLDLKRQLRASDRAALIGAANYILLIRKGDKETPATQDEVNHLKQNYNFLAKLPVIITDHRLTIDVIAPKLDFVLKPEAYDVLDQKILTRTLSAFLPPKVRTLDAPSWNDVICNSVQSRRHMIARTLEQEIARAVVNHPKNAGVFAPGGRPSLVFTPRTVSVGTDDATMQALLALRTQREVSRDTILEHLGLDEATEAQRMELEDELYDDIFKTQIPFASPGMGGVANGGAGQGQTPNGRNDSPGAPGASATVKPAAKKAAPAAPAKKTATPNGTPEAPKVSGGRGGRPVGGGSSAKSPAATARPKTSNGNPSTKER